ncbi:CoxG family protein [Bordetella genomosp. 13]|uniref:Carbon monoxide dehydrogenase n=1 Tax=Bordetella genomosp. 13 TaxID=463040 RepID=A0A1W6ZGX7_9BORD|nr:carbon monoxide dehydrogenase subunit G [Bordetella genomosp. 13]ARP96561.1 hypothetical protein CAL15_20660 [Bordetella genomosp. 13]
MILTGEKNLTLPRQRVWEGLNDPDILRQCIPGCDVFERESEHTFKVGMVLAIGPVKARFTGKLTLSDIVPPASYALTFEGSGGAAGFGKGEAQVRLADADAGTSLSYSMKAQVGGKLAQVGSRLIDGVARRVADDFFSRFARVLQQEPAGADPTSVPPSAGAVTSDSPAADSRRAQAPAEAVPAAARIAPASLPGSLLPAAAPVREDRSLAASIAVLGAAVSSVAAAVAVLAATIMILNSN